MSHTRKNFTKVEKAIIAEAIQNKLPKHTDRYVKEKLTKKLKRTYSSVSAAYYRVNKKIHSHVKDTPVKDKVFRKKSKVVWANEKMYNILTQEQRDVLLKDMLGI